MKTPTRVILFLVFLPILEPILQDFFFLRPSYWYYSDSSTPPFLSLCASLFFTLSIYPSLSHTQLMMSVCLPRIMTLHVNWRFTPCVTPPYSPYQSCLLQSALRKSLSKGWMSNSSPFYDRIPYRSMAFLSQGAKQTAPRPLYLFTHFLNLFLNPIIL